jgi:hypothetical protein
MEWNWGDALETALTGLGITKARVEAWVGAPCGCDERRLKLNQLGAWLRRVLTGKETHPERRLTELLEQEDYTSQVTTALK